MLIGGIAMAAKSKSREPRSPKPAHSTAIEQRIRQRAYELYEQRGRVEGLPLDDWLQAELEMSSATEIKRAFCQRVMQVAVWPMTLPRLDSIYSTLQRTFRGERDRNPLLQQLLAVAHDWDRQCPVVLKNQTGFDEWFFSQIELICGVDFAWNQAPKKGVVISHQHLSFGAAQKFLNLLLKDWWAKSEHAAELGALCGYLHAPLDDLVVSFISRARPALHVPSSVVYELDKPTYLRLQEVIIELSNELQAILRCRCKLTRIEFEQLVWGWIC
jgi:hypothetical protein